MTVVATTNCECFLSSTSSDDLLNHAIILFPLGMVSAIESRKITCNKVSDSRVPVGRN